MLLLCDLLDHFVSPISGLNMKHFMLYFFNKLTNNLLKRNRPISSFLKQQKSMRHLTFLFKARHIRLQMKCLTSSTECSTTFNMSQDLNFHDCSNLLHTCTGLGADEITSQDSIAPLFVQSQTKITHRKIKDMGVIWC